MALTHDKLVTIRPRMQLLKGIVTEELEVAEILDELANFPEKDVARILYRKYVQGVSWARLGIETGRTPDGLRVHCMKRLKAYQDA